MKEETNKKHTESILDIMKKGNKSFNGMTHEQKIIQGEIIQEMINEISPDVVVTLHDGAYTAHPRINPLYEYLNKNK